MIRRDGPEGPPLGPAPGFAVIGTGRSGTGYMAELLRTCGVDCGHEHWWTPLARRVRGNLDGDASWMALPDIENGTWSGPVVHVVRHPVAVVRSLLGVGLFDPSRARPEYAEFARAHEPGLAGLGELDGCVEWWARWNARCSAVADMTVRVEDMPARLASVSEALSRPLRLTREVSAGVNHRHRGVVDEAAVWRRLAGRAEAFGYGPEDGLCG